MEENKETPQAGNSAEAAKQPVDAKVTMTVTLGEDTKTTQVRFHTPTLLKAVSDAADGSTVALTVVDPGATEPRVLAKGTKEEVVKALEKSIVPAEAVAAELRKFAQFLIDHSTVKAIGCHAVCTKDDGTDGGFGFAATAEDCTTAEAVTFVNCGDANMDEFVSKAKLDIPGRHGAPAKGTVVTPTPEQVEKLG